MSDILDIAHDMAKDLHEVGLMDGMTMRVMDGLCAPKPEPLQSTPSGSSSDPSDTQEGFGRRDP